MPQLFLVFRLSCASGYLPSFFMVLHISTYYRWSLGVLFSFISLRFFIIAHVGDDIFGFFGFLVSFAMLIALCWIISVMFLFRLSMSSCSSSAVNMFFLVRIETCSSSFQSFVCQLLFVYSCLESAISCRSSICPGRLSTAWLVSLVVFSCHMVSKW